MRLFLSFIYCITLEYFFFTEIHEKNVLQLIKNRMFFSQQKQNFFFVKNR